MLNCKIQQAGNGKDTLKERMKALSCTWKEKNIKYN